MRGTPQSRLAVALTAVSFVFWLCAVPAFPEAIQIGANGTLTPVAANPYNFSQSVTTGSGATYTASGTLVQLLQPGLVALEITNLDITNTGTLPVSDAITFFSDSFPPFASAGTGAVVMAGQYANSSGTIDDAQAGLTFIYVAGLTPNPTFSVLAPAATNEASPVGFDPSAVSGSLPSGVFEIGGTLNFTLAGKGDSLVSTQGIGIEITPESSTFSLMALGLLLLALLAWRRRLTA